MTKKHEKLILVNVERNRNDSILELEIRDPKTGEKIRLQRIDDMHGDEKQVRIKLADNSRITGIINMGKYKRASDVFAYGRRFQPVYNATVDGAEDRTLFIHKDHVIWAEELGDVISSQTNK